MPTVEREKTRKTQSKCSKPHNWRLYCPRVSAHSHPPHTAFRPQRRDADVASVVMASEAPTKPCSWQGNGHVAGVMGERKRKPGWQSVSRCE
eukprot:5558286-Prymnesium_polylepis.1